VKLSDAVIHARRLQSLLVLVAMATALTFLSARFLTADNLLNIFRQISVNLCLSVGLTLVILSGGIDLSVGAVLALAGAVAAGLLKSGVDLSAAGVHLELTPFGAVLVALAVGAAAGLANGWIVTRLRVPAFIATLAMLSVARGLTMLWTGGFPITQLGQGFGFLGTGVWAGIPMPVWIVAVVATLAAFVCRRTPFGRHLYAVGGSERAARLTGLPVDRIRVIVYVMGGTLSGLAGCLVTARLDSAQPNAGLGYELDAIAAVVIGGTSLTGGRGSIGGTVLGCLLIGVLNDGLTLLDVSPFWQQVVKGLVIALAVALDRIGAPRERLT
jgi:ribose transport system permease protein